MRLPPAVIAMRIVEQGRTRFRIWFPLFLLWPLVLVLVVLTLTIAALVDVVMPATGQRFAYTRLIGGGLNVVGEIRGTELFIKDARRTVALTVR